MKLIIIDHFILIRRTDVAIKVIASPATSLSAIMVEAYKKYALVSLIVLGKVIFPPKFSQIFLEISPNFR